jgi:TetR/AcrR family transcriptional regulator, regulator of cefoperazone and chloramphenicol sensitivity
MGARVESLQDRGEATRQRLIDAALAVFGEFGFDGASTRMLADQAGANLAAIPYHFGSKEGLYRAAAQYIVERITDQTTEMLEEIEHALLNALPRTRALGFLHKYTDTMAAIMLGSKEADSWAAFIMKEQLQPGAAFEILYNGMMRRIHEVGAGLVAVLLKQPQIDNRIRLRAIAIFGQILIFRTSRHSVLRQLGWKEFSHDRLELIQSIIRENVDLIATGSA